MSIAVSVLRLPALAALLLVTTTTQAAIFLTENIAGTLGGSTLFDGVALGSDTAFSFEAVFVADPSFNLAAASPGVGVYPILSLSVTIAGKGTYAANLDTPLFTLLGDPSNGLFPAYFAGITGNDIGFLSFFSSTTPALDAHAPDALVFADYLVTMYGDPLTISLTGVTGGLVLSDGSLLGPVSAGLTVPEPATCAVMAAGGLLALAGWRRRRNARC